MEAALPAPVATLVLPRWRRTSGAAEEATVVAAPLRAGVSASGLATGAACVETAEVRARGAADLTAVVVLRLRSSAVAEAACGALLGLLLEVGGAFGLVCVLATTRVRKTLDVAELDGGATAVLGVGEWVAVAAGAAESAAC